MLLVTVEGGYFCHLVIGEGEVEDADVLLDVIRIAGTWDGYYVTLIVPAQNDLNDRAVVGFGYLDKDGIVEQFRLMTATSEWVPSLYDYAVVMNEIHDFCILIVRVNLVLYEHWLDANLG